MKGKIRNAICALHLHFLALSNLLLFIGGRRQPDITEGHLAFWLPTEKKVALCQLALT